MNMGLGSGASLFYLFVGDYAFVPDEGSERADHCYEPFGSGKVGGRENCPYERNFDDDELQQNSYYEGYCHHVVLATENR